MNIEGHFPERLPCPLCGEFLARHDNGPAGPWYGHSSSQKLRTGCQKTLSKYDKKSDADESWKLTGIACPTCIQRVMALPESERDINDRDDGVGDLRMVPGTAGRKDFWGCSRVRAHNVNCKHISEDPPESDGSVPHSWAQALAEADSADSRDVSVGLGPIKEALVQTLLDRIETDMSELRSLLCG